MLIFDKGVREKDRGKYEDEFKEEIEQCLGVSEEFRMVKSKMNIVLNKS
jgi:hypothetical protein